MTLTLDILNSHKDSICFVTKLVTKSSTIPYEGYTENPEHTNLGILLVDATITTSFLAIKIDDQFFAISSPKDGTCKYQILINPSPITDNLFRISTLKELGADLTKLDFIRQTSYIYRSNFIHEMFTLSLQSDDFFLSIKSDYYDKLNDIFHSYINKD